MDQQKRREIKEQYKYSKPPMGILSVTCKETGDIFVDAVKDLDRGFNRYKLQLETGSHPNKNLQALWKQYGESAFDVSVYKELEYDDPLEDQTGKLKDLLIECLDGNPQLQPMKKVKR